MVKWFIAARLSGLVRIGGLAIVPSLLLTACTGRGGGWLPPNTLTSYNDTASIGFSFSCEPTGNFDPNHPERNGRLHIALKYQDRSTSLAWGPFSIHGEADALSDTVNAFCADPVNAGPDVGVLEFEGVYTVQSGTPGDPQKIDCTDTFTNLFGETVTGCRFRAKVTDTGGRGPSSGDAFSIQLYGGATTIGSTHDLSPIIYTRTGTLGGGNFEVDNT